MDKIQIYVHGENSRELKSIEVSESSTVADILKAYQEAFPNAGSPDEIEIFLEDTDDPMQKNHSAEKSGVKKRSHIHCHRCKKVAVTIFYNGEDKLFHFPPSATAKNVLKKAIHAFNIKEADAGDYLLKLDDKTVLQATDHIGSFVSFPSCQLKLFLTPTKPVQG